MQRSHPILSSCFAALAACSIAGSAAAATVEGDRATFTWLPASGPVAGYDVFVIRNGISPSAAELTVAGETATVASQIDDRIAIQVAAFDAAGNQGPLSGMSEVVHLALPAPPPTVTVAAAGDFSLQSALAAAAPGEQVIAHLNGDARQLLDTSADPAAGIPEDQWGLDQLVVGDATQVSVVRLVDAIGMLQPLPLVDLPRVTLFGLGNGPPCQRDGAAGLVIHPGSRLVLGGIELYAFDGQSCVLVNDLFASSADPNVVSWGGGEIQLHGDLEGDGVLDPDDNCLLVANPDQCDGDRDGFGTACDLDPNGDGAAGLDDLSAIAAASQAISQNPAFDLNCDGVVGLDDVSLAMRGVGEVPGPSGLACAADATCFSP